MAALPLSTRSHLPRSHLQGLSGADSAGPGTNRHLAQCGAQLHAGGAGEQAAMRREVVFVPLALLVLRASCTGRSQSHGVQKLEEQLPAIEAHRNTVATVSSCSVCCRTTSSLSMTRAA